MIGERAGLFVKRPTAFNFAANRIIRTVCMSKAAAESGFQQNMFIGNSVFIAFDTQYIPEQPFGNRAVGEVVIRFAVCLARTVRIGPERIPAFPDSGGIGGNAVQP